MAKRKTGQMLDASTEDKIKAAAKTVFYSKGFAATRTRDIAQEAGINLALLNYYFRSKAKLFEIIMMETLSGFFEHILQVLDDEKTTLENKVEAVVSNYIDLILAEPEIPTFIITEIRTNPQLLLGKLPIRKIINNSVFVAQHQQAVADGKIHEPNPLHFLMNVLGLIVFPFIAKPILLAQSGSSETAFRKLMMERKKLIPVWVKAMMKGKVKSKR